MSWVQGELLGGRGSTPHRDQIPGGTVANQSGAAIEATLHQFLIAQGYAVRSQERLGTNIYGGVLMVDLYLPDLPLAIEVKWQESRGSTDEKFPYLVENCRHAYPCPVIVVVDGAGVRPGAVTWLRSQVDGRKLIEVLSLNEFFAYVLKRRL